MAGRSLLLREQFRLRTGQDLTARGAVVVCGAVSAIEEEWTVWVISSTMKYT